MVYIETYVEVLILAVLLDIFIGEPMSVFHPVVWFGKIIDVCKDIALRHPSRISGLIMVIACILAAYLLAVLVVFAMGIAPPVVGILIGAYFLKSTFSIRMLSQKAWDIGTLLVGISDGSGVDGEMHTMESIRKRLPVFVSRDVSDITPSGATSAVIESVSENFVDGILSPLFYYALFGLHGALVYKMINTMDSMVGYRNKKYVDVGFVAAKLDDIANWIPARISVLYIMLGAVLFSHPMRAFKVAMSDWANTPSPNSGWPMAAVAGALGIRLEKKDVYVLGKELEVPQGGDIAQAVIIVLLASLAVVCTMVLLDVFLPDVFSNHLLY